MPPPQPGARATVFVTYNGLLDPLGPSQILPYQEALNGPWRIHIISFERPDRLADKQAVRQMQARLERQGITWWRLRYHKWPSLLASTFDLALGALTLRYVIERHRVALIHARGYLPMSIALRATRKVPVLFDIRGLQAEEYVDGGVWKEGELKWRLAKRAERSFFAAAAGAVVLTENIKPYVVECFARAHRAPRVDVIPCCVDLERFTFDEAARVARRRSLGLADGTPLLVYSGSVGTWYLTDKMARFVMQFRAASGTDAHVLWLVNNDRAAVLRACAAAGLPADRVHIVQSPSADVPSWLAAADAGMALIQPSFSKRSSSPTKYAEYLAMGLPIVVSRDVGDSALVAEHGGAIALSEFDDHALREGATQLVPLLARPRSQFRQVASALFDLETVAAPSYRDLYRALARP
jgi:glycosyltransferase involved in cell wall biosynthesis